MSAPSTYRVRARNLATDSDNKIHDDTVARQFGFNGALVPGVDVFAYASHPFAEAWGLDFLRGGRLQTRFRRPVYDGELITVSASPADDGATSVTVTGADPESRAVGQAWPQASFAVDVSSFATVPLPAKRRPAGPEPLPLGPLGSIEESVDLDRHDAYLDGIDESLAVYRTERVAHPGALMRLVNNLLVCNVALGPWIHTASDAIFLAAGRLPATLTADGVVREEFERNGHHYVRYDALVRCDGEPVLMVDHTAIYRLSGT